MRDAIVKQQIDDVMDTFDFKRVHDVMKLLNWKWVSAESGLGVPSEYELRKKARMLMERSANERSGIGTGGFYAEYKEGIEDDKTWLSMNLSFRLCQSLNDGEFY